MLHNITELTLGNIRELGLFPCRLMDAEGRQIRLCSYANLETGVCVTPWGQKKYKTPLRIMPMSSDSALALLEHISDGRIQVS